MFNGTMDPDMIRIAQEQISRMSPAELARIQQQMMSNPELMRMASESMKNMRPEDFKLAAEQLKHTRPEQMAEIGEKMANATPDEIAAMRARADAQVKYELNAAEMLKKQGNELHSQGRFRDAMQKYSLAKQNIKEIPSSQSRKLLLACSLNLMSCYLKTRQYEECIKEGSEVLAYEAKNLKALYRRGQAYKELGLLKDAVNDLSMAYEVCPDDDTVAELLREAKEILAKKGGEHATRGLVIEEITEEVENVPSGNLGSSSAEQTVSQPKKSNDSSKSCSTVNNGNSKTTMENLDTFKNDPEAIRINSRRNLLPYAVNLSGSESELVELDSLPFSAISNGLSMEPIGILFILAISSGPNLRSFQNFMSNADPATLASLNAGQSRDVSPDMIKTASNMISKMSPDELQKMFDMASSFQGDNPFLRGGSPDSTFNPGSIPPNVTPDMIKTASNMIGKMPPEDLQKMFEMASSLQREASIPSSAAVDKNVRKASQSDIPSSSAVGSSTLGESSSSRDSFLNMRNASQSNFPSSSTDLQEQMRNQMKDPAMRQMFTSMMKNMSPEMMANMGEQFGFKLSKEEAEKAQQAMSSLSPEDLDKMLHTFGVCSLVLVSRFLIGLVYGLRCDGQIGSKEESKVQKRQRTGC
ncbi:outer envelope protein 61 [Senna tora]|uniref:Outer envelope protein 61 n=1 Tax=Senna tora TaxID=362788 RepID=A0A834W1M0_9FABA|nr:outer envelope protein 61 [Senna tora]